MAAGGEKSIAGGSSSKDLKRKGAKKVQKLIIEIKCKLPTMRTNITYSLRRVRGRFRLGSEESEGDVHDGRLGGARG